MSTGDGWKLLMGIGHSCFRDPPASLGPGSKHSPLPGQVTLPSCLSVCQAAQVQPWPQHRPPRRTASPLSRALPGLTAEGRPFTSGWPCTYLAASRSIGGCYSALSKCREIPASQRQPEGGEAPAPEGPSLPSQQRSQACVMLVGTAVPAVTHLEVVGLTAKPSH